MYMIVYGFCFTCLVSWQMSNSQIRFMDVCIASSLNWHQDDPTKYHAVRCEVCKADVGLLETWDLLRDCNTFMFYRRLECWFMLIPSRFIPPISRDVPVIVQRFLICAGGPVVTPTPKAIYFECGCEAGIAAAIPSKHRNTGVFSLAG